MNLNKIWLLVGLVSCDFFVGGKTHIDFAQANIRSCLDYLTPDFKELTNVHLALDGKIFLEDLVNKMNQARAVYAARYLDIIGPHFRHFAHRRNEEAIANCYRHLKVRYPPFRTLLIREFARARSVLDDDVTLHLVIAEEYLDE